MQTVFIYDECSVHAGRKYYSDPENAAGNATEFEVSIAEYKRLRRASRKAGAGRDLFLRRSANTIMDELR